MLLITARRELEFASDRWTWESSCQLLTAMHQLLLNSGSVAWNVVISIHRVSRVERGKPFSICWRCSVNSRKWPIYFTSMPLPFQGGQSSSSGDTLWPICFVTWCSNPYELSTQRLLSSSKPSSPAWGFELVALDVGCLHGHVHLILIEASLVIVITQLRFNLSYSNHSSLTFAYWC